MELKLFGSNDVSLSNTTAVITAVTAVVGMAFLYRSKNKDSEAKQKIEKTWDSRAVHEHGSLTNVWPNVMYSLEAPGCSMGPPIRNMHIYRVPDDSNRLVIYNGVSVHDATLKDIEALGVPSILVVPNWMHREDAAIWKQKFPNIIVVCPSIAKAKVMEEVSVDMTIEEWAASKEWSPYVAVKEINGWAKFELVVELELESINKESNGKNGTIAMVVCDLLFTLIDSPNFSYSEKFISWFFDSSILLPSDPKCMIIVPAISRIARVFAIKDWKRVEQWYRSYAKEYGGKIAMILVGHGVPVLQVDPDDGCTKALEGVADQLIKPRW
jgi:hypothetical protein